MQLVLDRPQLSQFAIANFFNKLVRSPIFWCLAVLALFMVLPLDAIAQTLPPPPGGTNTDPFAATGKTASTGVGYALIIGAIIGAVISLFVIVKRLAAYAGGKADWGDLMGSALIAFGALAVSIAFAAYGLKLLADNKTYLESGIQGNP